MNSELLPLERLDNHILEIKYVGPSFDGQMEIGSLSDEINGLENALKIIILTLFRNGRINFKLDDITIFVQTLERGSFKHGVKIVWKRFNKNSGGISTIFTILSFVLILIKDNGGIKIKEMSSQLISEIGDQVKVELLQDHQFHKAIADIVRPIKDKNDKLIFTTEDQNTPLVVSCEDKEEFLKLTENQQQTTLPDGEYHEVLKGRINLVNIDATKNNIGFKINGIGNTIPTSLPIANDINEMKMLLDQWIEINATSTVVDGRITHINVDRYHLISQQSLDFFKKDK